MTMKLFMKPAEGFPNRTDFEIYNGDFLIVHFMCENGNHSVFSRYEGHYVLSANSFYFSLTEEMFYCYCSYFSDDPYALRMVKHELKKRAT